MPPLSSRAVKIPTSRYFPVLFKTLYLSQECQVLLINGKIYIPDKLFSPKIFTSLPTWNLHPFGNPRMAD